MARIELELLGGAVIAVDQRHLVRKLGIVVPKLDGADMLLVVAAEQHHDRQQELAGEDRQRNAAGEAGRHDLVGTLGVGVCKLGEDHGMAARPGFAGQAFAIGEQRILADGRELGIFRTAEAAAEFESSAGTVRHP